MGVLVLFGRVTCRFTCEHLQRFRAHNKGPFGCHSLGAQFDNHSLLPKKKREYYHRPKARTMAGKSSRGGEVVKTGYVIMKRRLT